MFFVRQGATHKIVVGPVVAVGDGFTPITTLALSSADEAEVILHDNGTVVDISGYTWAAITTADGYYHLTLQSGISNTVGHVTVVINDDSLCLPVKAQFTVLEEVIYDAMFAASANTFTGAAGSNAVRLVDTLTTYTGNTPQTGDTYALANGAAGFVAIDTVVDAILVDTNELQTDWTNGGRLDLIIDATLADTNELQTDWVNGGRLDLIIDATLADTNELQTDWVNGGRLDLIVDAILDDTDLIDDATSGLAKIATDVAAILVDTAVIGADGAGLTDLGGFSTTAKAQINTEVDGAIETYHLDHLFAATYDPASKPGAADALLNEIIGSDAGVSQFTANALELGPAGSGGDATAANQTTMLGLLQNATYGLDKLARTGADSDTLETLSDQLDGVTGGAATNITTETTIIEAD